MTGSVSGTAVILFFIVFFWTPPHFWALSLLMKDEYAKVNVPMMPVVRGEAETRRQILLYTILLYAVTQLPFCAGGMGGIYLAASLVLGVGFIHGAVRLYSRATRSAALQLYLFSLAYLALLFGAMVADSRLEDRRHGPQPRTQEHPLRSDRHGGLPVHVRHDLRGRGHLRERVSPPDREIPPAGEEIHLPEGSLQPVLLAFFLTVALVGVTTTWILSIFGGIGAIWVIIRWIRDARHELSELPAHHDQH